MCEFRSPNFEYVIGDDRYAHVKWMEHTQRDIARRTTNKERRTIRVSKYSLIKNEIINVHCDYITLILIFLASVIVYSLHS